MKESTKEIYKSVLLLALPLAILLLAISIPLTSGVESYKPDYKQIVYNIGFRQHTDIIKCYDITNISERMQCFGFKEVGVFNDTKPNINGFINS